jgi:hypothetical protein
MNLITPFLELSNDMRQAAARHLAHPSHYDDREKAPASLNAGLSPGSGPITRHVSGILRNSPGELVVSQGTLGYT